MIGGADLIICGRQTTDGDTAQVGPLIVKHLTIPHAAWVAEVTDVTDHSITVRQDLVSVSQVSELPYPCLITIEFLERELIDILFPDIFKGEPSFTRFSFILPEYHQLSCRRILAVCIFYGPEPVIAAKIAGSLIEKLRSGFHDLCHQIIGGKFKFGILFCLFNIRLHFPQNLRRIKCIHVPADLAVILEVICIARRERQIRIRLMRVRKFRIGNAEKS